MYLQFYGFSEAPFNLTPDSKFLFLSHRHQEALAALLFGVMERKGFICLTGEIGCGKTTLCRAMLAQLDSEQVKTCVVLNSYLNDLELLKTINEGFGLPAESDSKKALLDALNNFLVAEFSAGRNIVLIIDEAQNLRPETLEQIRMISNLETETAKLIQIIMVGQPELRRTLSLPELEQLNQRITVRYHITPLAESEIPDYIRHRVVVAQPQVDVKFAPQAIRLIHHYSHGVPRRINVICDRCLLVGYVQGALEIDDKIVQRAVDELRGESGGMAAPAPGAATPATAATGAGGGGAMKWLGYAALFIVVIGAAIYGGMWLSNMKSAGGAAVAMQPTPPGSMESPSRGIPVPGGDTMPVVTPPPGRPSTTPPSSIATPGQTPPPAAPTPQATASPTPTPAPTPTPPLFDNWTWDRDGVLRVNLAQLSEAASYLELLRQWFSQIDLSSFKKATPAEVSQFDLLKTVKQLNFEAFTTDKLDEALSFDLPVIVRIGGAGDKMGPYGVLTSMQGNQVLELADPLHGKMTVSLATLKPLVTQAVVLYQDTEHWAGLAVGATGEPVEKLQRWLMQQGLYQGTVDGKYGTLTHDAIEKLQQNQGLQPTGALDTPTAISIYARLNPRRPKLFS